MSTKLIKKVSKYQMGGNTTNMVSSVKNPDFYNQLKALGVILNKEQAKATAQWQAANPSVPVSEFLQRARQPGFNNTKLDSTFNSLKDKYGDLTIPMSPEYQDVEAKYTDLTNKIRGLPMSSTGTKEDTVTKKVGYRTMLKRYPREIGEAPYQFLNKTQ